MAKIRILSLNPFVRGVLIAIISFSIAFVYGALTGNAMGSFLIFILLAATAYETLVLETEKAPASYLIMFCRGSVLVAVGFVVGRFFGNSFFGVGIMALIYELMILPKAST